MKTKQKIFVGISGGVDSSVAAYLLLKKNYDVHGVFIKTWSPEWLPCTWLAEKRDAMRVCAALGIPFHFLDAEEEYKKGVADYMIAEYGAGRTPNPDVLCNRVIKFGVLWDYAKNAGADFVATGHYARIGSTTSLENTKSIITAVDKSKDQSYFLWTIRSDELDHIMFPIGNLKKNEVRKIADKINLFTSNKKDSQGICFLGDIDMKEFLKHYIEMKPGQVLDTEGNIIGEHDGVWFYTLGERHGFRILKKTNSETPYYVVGKNIKKNQIIVSKKELLNKIGDVTLNLRDMNWLIKPNLNKEYLAQIRYHGELIKTHFIALDKIQVKHSGIIALGQSVVIFDGEVMVGGAIIDKIS